MNQAMKEQYDDWPRFLHICEVCGKTEMLTPKEAFDDGWDYPPIIGAFGVVSPRTCGACTFENTAWAALILHHKRLEDLTDRQKATVFRILWEPESLQPE